MLAIYTPRCGDIVHLRPSNCWGLPAARYTLRHQGGTAWDLEGPAGLPLAVCEADLAASFAALDLTPISRDQLEREAQLARLGAAAPLQGRRAQHDCSGLALFRAANEPALF